MCGGAAVPTDDDVAVELGRSVVSVVFPVDFCATVVVGPICGLDGSVR